jgi:hypothetical protein
MTANIIPYIHRLAERYETGKNTISVKDLFSNTDLSKAERSSVIEILESKQLIKCIYETGQRLPYQINILPGVIDARSKIPNKYSFDEIKNRLLSCPPIALAMIIFIPVAAIIGLIVLIWPELFSAK